MIGPAEIEDMLAEYADRDPRQAANREPPAWPPVLNQAPHPGNRYFIPGRAWSECFGWAKAPGTSVLG